VVGVDLQGGGVSAEGLVGSTGAFKGEGEVGAWVGVAGEELSGPGAGGLGGIRRRVDGASERIKNPRVVVNVGLHGQKSKI
jgi:hypothetical protein